MIMEKIGEGQTKRKWKSNEVTGYKMRMEEGRMTLHTGVYQSPPLPSPGDLDRASRSAAKCKFVPANSVRWSAPARVTENGSGSVCAAGFQCRARLTASRRKVPRHRSRDTHRQ